MAGKSKGGPTKFDIEQREHTKKGLRLAAWQLYVAVAGVVVAVVAIFVSVKVSEASSAQSDSSHAPPALALTEAWPWITGCPATGSSIAMPVGGGAIQQFHSESDLRSTLAENGAGSWGYGQFYLDMAAAPSKSVEIVGIKPHIQRRDLAAPAWVYVPDSGCGPNAGDRVFRLDLDAPLLVDTGLETGPGGQHPSYAPTESLGPDFVLSGSRHARVRVDAYSCRGNYQWAVDVQYIETGKSGVQTTTVSPLKSYGIADNTPQYVAHQDATGAAVVDKVSMLSGDVPATRCSK